MLSLVLQPKVSSVEHSFKSLKLIIYHSELRVASTCWLLFFFFLFISPAGSPRKYIQVYRG